MILRDAPAKINLSLRVLRRREDGFHEIATRIAPLTLTDRLTLEKLPGAGSGTVAFTCDDPTVPADETNLAVKAVRALETHTGPLPGVRLHLEKRIPHGAGLGGGSSDAAAVLLGMNELFSLTLSAATLQTAAATIGSDVPFFLHGCVCDCTGRGETVTPLSDFTWHPRVLLIKPPFGIPTPGIYRRWRDSRELPGLFYSAQETPGGPLVNDLERPAFEKYPVLGTLKARLLACEGVTAALMSGSGSTVFAVLEPGADAVPVIEAARQEMGEEIWFCDTAVR
jgi:4-diphosphocytidyl-2-C-methyl-D-erythritol kinase